MRDAGNYTPGYDLEAMKRGLEAEGCSFTLFGGEPLLMKFLDLEEILRWGFEKYGKTSIQTNGSLITPSHVELFKRYRTGIGISVDGPGELNDSRWAGNLERTRETTARSFAAIDMLIAAGIVPSLIVTLYRGNASPERLPRLIEWLKELDRKGITDARLHALEVDHALVRDGMLLSEDESSEAFARLFELQGQLRTLKFDVFSDMAKLLLGSAEGSCIWHGCDPLTTPAVRAVNGLGGRSNCSRTNKDGIDWVKADMPHNERSLALFETPYEDGGCQGCRFFFACQGNCPGTSINGDWRNRSEQCSLWLRTFERVESALVSLGKKPISIDDELRGHAERAVLFHVSGNREHGDHWDAPNGYVHSDAGFEVHGDNGTTTVHGDTPHGDHNDA